MTELGEAGNLPRVCVVYLLRDHAGRGPQVVLGRKRTGLGTGRWVAPGGKLEPGESAADAAVREVSEECGLLVHRDALQQRGELRYLFPHRPAWSQHSTVFVCEDFSGEPGPSAELDAGWVPVDALPLERMWDDARLWLPRVLAGGSVRATISFADDLTTVSHADMAFPVDGVMRVGG